MRLRPIIFSLVAFLSLSLMVSLASAQPTATQRATAEALFNAGKKLLDDGSYAEACKKFEASQKLDAGVGTILYLGACYEKLGKTASAWAAFREAASLASASGQSDRADVAQERANKLESELVRITIKVPSESQIEGLVVTQDGVGVLPATFGVPTPVDPGSHAIEASAPGYETWRSTVVIPVGSGNQTIELPPLTKSAEEPAAPPVVPVTIGPQTAPPPSASGPDAPTSSGDGQRIAAAVVGGIGVVGLAIGTVFAVVASGKDDDASEICEEDNACSTVAGVQLSDDARSAGNIATVGFAVGAVAVATAVVLFVTAPSGDGAVAQDAGNHDVADVVWESLTLRPTVGALRLDARDLFAAPETLNGGGLWLEGKLP